MHIYLSFILLLSTDMVHNGGVREDLVMKHLIYIMFLYYICQPEIGGSYDNHTRKISLHNPGRT